MVKSIDAEARAGKREAMALMPVPVEVKVPMVAIVSLPLVSRAATTAASMAVDGPEAINPHPLIPAFAMG